jgi:hypothetical protein
MHIIDFNRNKRVDKDELKALLHQLTLSNWWGYIRIKRDH